MPHHEQVKIAGTVVDIFAHRFVLDTTKGHVLADIGPKGAEKFHLKMGGTVTIEGEQKPSEIKVTAISMEGGKTVVTDHPRPHDDKDHVDPKIASDAAVAAGYTVTGKIHRKPKHFEVQVRNKLGHDAELHIGLDGHIRKEAATHSS